MQLKCFDAEMEINSSRRCGEQQKREMKKSTYMHVSKSSSLFIMDVVYTAQGIQFH